MQRRPGASKGAPSGGGSTSHTRNAKASGGENSSQVLSTSGAVSAAAAAVASSTNTGSARPPTAMNRQGSSTIHSSHHYQDSTSNDSLHATAVASSQRQSSPLLQQPPPHWTPPPVRLLRWLLMLPLFTLAVILMAGIYVHNHHHNQHINLALSNLPNIAHLPKPPEARKQIIIPTVNLTKQQSPHKPPDASNTETPPNSKDHIKYMPKFPSQIPSGNATNYHLVFSTGCSAFQDWQSYVFFFHAHQAQQPGHVTRIASGCDATTQAQLQRIFDETIRPMNPQFFHIHFTPDFGRIVKPGVNYKYFNKPYGTKHWLEHGLGYSQVGHDNPPHDDTIVILFDPDQVIMRPFRDNDFSGDTWKFIPKGEQPRKFIAHGAPMGQMYGFALQWKTKVTMEHVAAGDLPSPVDDLTNPQAQRGFIVGPPYIATARDMYAIATYWAKFVPRVHDQYPHLLAEMFAYSLAAAHLQLPHQTATSFMVSSTSSNFQEGWKMVDNVPTHDTCTVSDTAVANSSKPVMPRVFHFCQRYNWGPYFFGKNRFPKNFISCESPLLHEPPANALERYEASYAPPAGEKKEIKPVDAKRLAFSVCTLLRALNQAASYYKQHHCSDDKANHDKSLVFVNPRAVKGTSHDYVLSEGVAELTLFR